MLLRVAVATSRVIPRSTSYPQGGVWSFLYDAHEKLRAERRLAALSAAHSKSG
jgi:hypothetical protein